MHDLRSRHVNTSSRIAVHRRRDSLRVPITSTDQPAFVDEAHAGTLIRKPCRRPQPTTATPAVVVAAAASTSPRAGVARSVAAARGVAQLDYWINLGRDV